MTTSAFGVDHGETVSKGKLPPPKAADRVARAAEGSHIVNPGGKVDIDPKYLPKEFTLDESKKKMGRATKALLAVGGIGAGGGAGYGTAEYMKRRKRMRSQ